MERISSSCSAPGQAAFQHDFADVLAGLGTDLADDVAFMVTDEGVQVGHDADGVQHVVHADVRVGGDAFHALLLGRCRLFPSGSGIRTWPDQSPAP